MTVRLSPGAVVASGLVLALAACTEPSGNSPSPSIATTTPGGTSPSVSPSDPAPSTSQDPRDSQALLDAVRERGSISVILSLAVDYTPEAKLPDAEAVRRQRARIADAQQRLVAELAAYRTEVRTLYKRWPQMSVTVDEAALRHLLASPLVTKIHQDRANSTTD